jgi:hypothetical protein
MKMYVYEVSYLYIKFHICKYNRFKAWSKKFIHRGEFFNRLKILTVASSQLSCQPNQSSRLNGFKNRVNVMEFLYIKNGEIMIDWLYVIPAIYHDQDIGFQESRHLHMYLCRIRLAMMNKNIDHKFTLGLRLVCKKPTSQPFSKVTSVVFIFFSFPGPNPPFSTIRKRQTKPRVTPILWTRTKVSVYSMCSPLGVKLGP